MVNVSSEVMFGYYMATTRILSGSLKTPRLSPFFVSISLMLGGEPPLNPNLSPPLNPTLTQTTEPATEN